MEMHTIVTVLVCAVVSSSALTACGSGETVVGAGQVLVQNNACGSCHSGSKGTLAGGDSAIQGVYPPNITPDRETGIGRWTDEQIETALRSGKDNEGASLCSAMPRFQTLSDEDLMNIVTFLRSLQPVSNEVPGGTCEPDGSGS
jgi:mono/diheme cytochrome c family protein